MVATVFNGMQRLRRVVTDVSHFTVQTGRVESGWAEGLLSSRVVVSHTDQAGQKVRAIVVLPRASGLESSGRTLDVNELDEAVRACRPRTREGG